MKKEAINQNTTAASELTNEEIKLKVPVNASYGTGKRKSSIAKVWLFPGKGTIVINNKNLLAYLKREVLVQQVQSPLNKLGLDNKYDIKISVYGGGMTGQAQAARLGVARALVALDENFRSKLREDSLLTRDARVKERKKYGRKRARKGYQFRKR